MGASLTRLVPPPITSSRWGARTKRIVVIAVLVMLAFFLWNVRGVLALLIISTLLAYLSSPLVNLIERRVLGFLPFRARTLAVILTFLTAITALALFLIVIAPVFVEQFSEIGDRLPEALSAAEREVQQFLSQPIKIGGRPILIDGKPVILLQRIQEISGNDEPVTSANEFDVFETLGSFLGSVSGLSLPVFSVLGGAVNFVINLAFMFVIMFYLMRDGEKFTDHLVELTPQSYRGDVRRLLYELGKVWDAYLRGQLILCFAVGFAVYIAALVLGLPNALLLGLLAGILEFIPNFGPFIAAVPAVLIALVSTSSTIPFLSGIPYAMIVALTWTGIQNVEAMFLVPRVMGGSLNLHPVVVIVAVIAGASVAGALGVILAAPFTATARVFGQYIYGKLFDAEPFPSLREFKPRWTSRLVVLFVGSRLMREAESHHTSASSSDAQPAQITEEVNS